MVNAKKTILKKISVSFIIQFGLGKYSFSLYMLNKAYVFYVLDETLPTIFIITNFD